MLKYQMMVEGTLILRWCSTNGCPCGYCSLFHVKVVLKWQVIIFIHSYFDRILEYFVLLLGLKHNGMSSIKITLASQARCINQYKNLRTKVMKCFTNIYFNWPCLIKKIIPNYAKINIPYTSPATKIIFIHCCTVLTVSLKHFVLLWK